MKTLIINIKQLVQVREINVEKVSGAEMKNLPVLEDAFLLIENDRISDFGLMRDLPEFKYEKRINAEGKIVLPAWIDSHTHIVYAGNRVQEFVDRINGLSYQEIANRGGGILNSAELLNNTTEEELYNQSKNRLEEVISQGTGAIEIKSGYGLSLEGELKMLRVIKKLKENYPLPIKATFLGAHAFPKAYIENKQSYIDLLINEMIPRVAQEKLADYIDVFLETGYFSVQQTKQIIEAGKKYQLPAKIHVNQFTSIGGVQMCVENDVLSIDHLEIMTDQDIESLKNSKTMPVVFPACSYFLGIPYAPARKIISAGLPLALASDFNPGSTPSGNMNFVVATACIKMKITPEEAINAATINSAYAIGLQDEVGSITKGKKANLIITKKIPNYYQIPYSFGTNLINYVMIDGKEVFL